MSSFHAAINGHVVIPGTYTAGGGTTNFHIGFPPSQDRPARPRKPFSTVPFAPDPDFVDRPEILTWVRSKCAGPGARGALVGLGGVGKSQLAIQHAHSVRDAAPHTFVFWVHAGTRTRFEEAYRGIADRLELPGRDHPEANVSQLVCNWLQDEANGTWLMILDNADDVGVFYPKKKHAKDRPGSVSTSLADYLPQSRNGLILITSRNKDAAAQLAGGHHNIKEVLAFGEDQALQLLLNKLQHTSSGEGAFELVRSLGYLPLAITQAAAYINRHAPRLTASGYLDEFRKSSSSKESLLNRDGGDLRRDKSASNSVVTTWQLTFECVRKERRSAADLLSLMSFFNPQAIPEFALRSYAKSAEGRVRRVRDVFSVSSILQHLKDRDRSDDEEGFHDDVAVLRTYSLVNATAEKGVLKMHPLVQHCTIAWLSSTSKADRWRLAFLELITRELLSKKLGNWEEGKQLVPHIDTFFPGEPGDKPFDRWIHLIIDGGWLLRRNGKYNEAVILFRRALEGREKQLGAQHLDTLASIVDLASVLQAQGKHNEAEKLNRRALEGSEKQLGAQHPNTLTSVSNLANVLQDRGEYDEAEKLARRALEGREEQLGAQHPNTLTSVSNLANVLQDRGEYDEAEKLHRRALEGYEKQLGAQHLDTLISVNNLASVLKAQGKHDEAETLHRRALEGSEKQLGAQHPDTLKSVNNLANVLQAQGKHDEAENLHRRALEGYKKQLGAQHPDTLTSVNNLANVLQAQGEYDEAENLHRRALEGREKQLGAQHPDTLMSVNNLATVLWDQRKYDEAEKLSRRALEGREKQLGAQHPDTLTSVGILALVLRHRGEYDEAEKLHRRALEGREKKLGHQHPDTLVSMSGLAYGLRQQKRYKEAGQLYQQACNGLTQTLGPQHPETVACLNRFSAMKQELDTMKPPE